MTNWRSLLDEYQLRLVHETSSDFAPEDTHTETELSALEQATIAARRAIELALNKHCGMCWSCGVSGFSAQITPDKKHWICSSCTKPYDAPEGT